MKDGERHTKVAWLLKYLGTCCCERGLLLPRVGCRGEGGVGGGGGGGGRCGHLIRLCLPSVCGNSNFLVFPKLLLFLKTESLGGRIESLQ